MKTYTKEFAAKFKKSYAYKMGGSQTIQLPNGQQFEFNDKEFYSGRGQKYNDSIRHDNKGLIVVTRKELSAALKAEKEQQARVAARQKEREAAAKKYTENKAAGIYGLAVKEYGTFVELSDDEKSGQYFDAERLAKTLNIKLSDALLLNSRGKTYVFAEKLDGSGVLELYHNSLSCNELNIWVTKTTPERVKEYNHADWASAPFSDMVGMTHNKNHFVC